MSYLTVEGQVTLEINVNKPKLWAFEHYKHLINRRGKHMWWQ